MRRLIVLIVFTGCITPSIPIPPPDPTQMDITITPDGTNTLASLTYPPTSEYIGGVYAVYDEANGMGVLQSAGPDGSCPATRPTPAKLGDQVVITMTLRDQTQSTCVILRAGPQSLTPYCQ
jgi:hypothetical protein